MITLTQAKQYMDQALGISVPDFLLQAAVDKVATVDVSGYAAYDQTLIQSMAVTIVAAAGSPRRIGSQGAPSGASRSFSNDAKALSDLRKSLKALDTDGLVAAIVGPDPANQAFMFVV